MNLLRLSLALTGVLALAAGGWADEEKVDLAKLPAKVSAAVKDKFQGAELVSASKESEDGKLLYEVQIKHQGKVVEVTLTEDGTIHEVETTIDPKDLPAAVTAALNKDYPTATIRKAETIEKGGKTDYEVLIVTTDKKTVEIKYDKDGKVVEKEDKTGKKDDEDDRKDKK